MAKQKVNINCKLDANSDMLHIHPPPQLSHSNCNRNCEVQNRLIWKYYDTVLFAQVNMCQSNFITFTQGTDMCQLLIWNTWVLSVWHVSKTHKCQLMWSIVWHSLMSVSVTSTSDKLILKILLRIWRERKIGWPQLQKKLFSCILQCRFDFMYQ